MNQKVYENHLDDREAKWFAVYTRYKREKLAYRLLEEQDICTYLPIQKVRRRWTRKVRVVELPLISCYIFVKITKAEYVKVLSTEYIVSFVKFSKNLISIPEDEIQVMKRVLGEDIEVDVEKTSFRKGDEVEIIAGNLIGLKGKLVQLHGNQKVLIELENLGYTLQLSIDKQLLRKTSLAFQE